MKDVTPKEERKNMEETEADGEGWLLCDPCKAEKPRKKIKQEKIFIY